MHIRLLTIGVLCFWLFHSILYNEAIVFKFTNAVCETFNKSWFLIHECRLKAISRNKTVLNFNGTVLHPVNNIQLDAQFLQKANGYKPWLYKIRVDICKFVKKPFNPVAIIIFKLVREFSNYNHTCPYMGTQLVRGFYLRSNMLPHSMPTGDYLLKLSWSFDNRVQFKTDMYFAFVEDF